MSTNVPAACKAAAARIKRESAENSKLAVQPLNKQQSDSKSSKGILVIGNCSTTVEVTVTAKERKRSSTMVTDNYPSSKTIEENKKLDNIDDDQFSWSHILREQNLPAVTQGFHTYCGRIQSSKLTEQNNSEVRDIEKNVEITKPDEDANDHTVKQVSSRRKSIGEFILPSNSVIPSATSCTNSTEYVIVVDRAVQCNGIIDNAKNQFSVFDSVRTLGFFMKELEDLISDEKASKILTDMKQTILRISTDPAYANALDVDSIALHTKLEASTAKLEATSKGICETFREQTESLQQQIHHQALLLDKARQREALLEFEMKQLKIELTDMEKVLAENQNTIFALVEENKRVDLLRKMCSELRMNLNEQIELAQQKFMDVQYLSLEREKLLVLSSYKDSQLIELRSAIKELQSHITEQLFGLEEANKHSKANSDEQNSVIVGGIACSSPTSTSSECSVVPQTWRGLSDISVSSVDPGSFYGSIRKNITENKPKNVVEKGIEAQLEFVSLPGSDTLHSISLPISNNEQIKQIDSATEPNITSDIARVLPLL
ncbi:uncharacterized protein LOC107263205 [Cephus cinctus]|uniref:Uncharacterized protein LOC107263205 n=1 Tax=Cephus cinctus TaxID=211228 RepID=A0AAJ7FCY9_CEPCN|nr:uncharacterized protein LOC107263205 [Cephus cinctus]